MPPFQERRSPRKSRSYYKKKKKKIKQTSDSSARDQHFPPNNAQKKDISEEEKRIRQIGTQSYNKALEHYFFPSLPTPNLVFDYEKNTGFHINFQNYQITLNLANTPNIYLDQELKDYFHSLSIHEIGHYVYCPYDNTTNLRLLGAAIKSGINKYYAPIILNIFADLLIDYRNYQDFPKLMEWELKTTVNHFLSTNTENIGILWKLLVRSYEIMWKIKILPEDMDLKSIDQYAKKICDIILKNIEEEALWEEKIKKMSKILKVILKKECNINDQQYHQVIFGDKRGNIAGMNPVEVPDDVKQTFGDLTQIKYPDFIKNSDKDRTNSTGPEARGALEQCLEDIAPDLEYDTFRDLLNINGFTDSNLNLALWYRGKAKNLLEINLFRKRPGGSLPFAPEVWRLGEPIEKLDIIQTLLTSPVIIPNITTRKWNFKQGPGILESDVLPDLMIVLDSSGSMDWNFTKKSIDGRYHIALTAAFAALHFGIQKGVYVSGINFSDRVKYVKWSNKPNLVESLLLSYQGYGTILPMTKVKYLADANEHPCLILLISDLEIDNWEAVFKDFKVLLQNGHQILSFIIEGDKTVLENDDLKELMELGVLFYILEDTTDLIGLVIKEVQNIYK